MKRLREKIVTIVASASLVAGLVPAPALAEMAKDVNTQSKEERVVTVQAQSSDDTQAEQSSIQFRFGNDQEWQVIASIEDAYAREASDITQAAFGELQVRVEGTDVLPSLQVTKSEDGSLVQAVQVELPVELAASDVWYRVHAGELGWLGWARNNQMTGVSLDGVALDGVQMLLVSKDTPLPENNPAAFVEQAVADGKEGPEQGPAEEQPANQEQSATDEEASQQDGQVSGDAQSTVASEDASKAKDKDEAAERMRLEEREREERLRTEAEKRAREEEEKEKARQLEKELVASEKDAKTSKTNKTNKSDSTTSKTTDSKKADATQNGLTAQAQTPSITYQAHVQRIGWQNSVKDGVMAGTSGQSLRMEALRVSLSKGTDGGVEYQAHVQRIGWQNWVRDGKEAGTHGQSLRVEGFKMKLTGEIAKTYDIYYRTHIQKFGWLAWAKNGESTGSEGLALRMEALEVRLVKKGGQAPTSSDSFKLSFIDRPALKYRGHVQRIGWQGWVNEGAMAGTSGQSLRVESLQTDVDGAGLTGEVHLNAHVQRIGWQPTWGTTCGTTGQALRVEAICAQLTGDLAKYFDIYYRVHAQRIGWMGWAKNGQQAGTSAMSLRLEAIEMRLVNKGWAAPGSTDNCYIDGTTVSKMGYQNPAGFYQVSSKNVSITSQATAPWDYVTPSRIGVWATRQDCVNAFIGRAREYLGTPYVWDYSCAPGVGVDCIGLVYQCAYACGMDLGGGTGYDDFNPWAHWITGSGGWHSHDANNFWDYGRAMHVSLDDRQEGDLISWAGHVAIYLGDDQIIEAYPGSVMYSSLWAHGTPRGCIRLFH